MFGGTYCCEQLFSKMKYTKSRLRDARRYCNRPALGPPSKYHYSVVEIIHRAGHWQAAPAVSLICLLFNTIIVIIHCIYILILGFSFVTPAHGLLQKVSSGPRSEKVARPCSIATASQFETIFYHPLFHCKISPISLKLGGCGSWWK